VNDEAVLKHLAKNIGESVTDLTIRGLAYSEISVFVIQAA